MRRGAGRPALSSLPVPKTSRGSPSVSPARGHAHQTHSPENLSRSGGNSHNERMPQRGSSLMDSQKKTLSPLRNSAAGEAQAGVRYITEELISKISREDNVEMILSLNLTLAKEGGKKIRYIENLHKLRRLQVLNLSGNMIERMEKLDRLLHLQELNLAHNCISRIEGLENLTGLRLLNLSNNYIQHIPAWFSRKLQALQILKISNNQLTSLSELARLKGIGNLIQLEMSGNPLSDFPHSRLYIVFHLRCVEVLDGQQVSAAERDKAQDRFALDEVQTLEQRLEQEESRYRQLEESHNRSEQERSQQEITQKEMRGKERQALEEISQLQQELQAKDDLLKRKMADLNKACEKHYQLEQELAFYKIDSKFQSLGQAPPPQQDLSSDDGGLMGESPYIGRARYQANQFAQEGQVLASPQRVQVHSLKAPVPGSQPSLLNQQLQAALDAELEKKQKEVVEMEEKLQELQQDLSNTEQKLLSATLELKKMAPVKNTPEHFQDDSKFQIRQKLAKKMQTVNKMRDHATQMEDEIDRVQQSISQGRAELNKLQSELQGLSPQSPVYQNKQRQMVDREQQVSQDLAAYSEMHNDLERTLQTIAEETTDIKRLEEQLTADQIEQNETLRSELEDIVSGLQGYLEGLKGQNLQHRQAYEMLLQEKEALEEKMRRQEAELSILDTEAQNVKVLQKQLEEAEKELNKTQNLSHNLQDDLHKSRQKGQQVQDRLQQAETEIERLSGSLIETEKKAQMEKKAVEQQLQVERERLEKMTQRVQDANRQDLEAKKLLLQLEATKALNSSLRDQMEDLKQKQRQEEEDIGFKPSDLKKRLRKFTHDFKTNKGPGEPVNKDDFLGSSLKEIYQVVQDKVNKSMREVNDVKKVNAKIEAEMQVMKEKLKDAQVQVKNQDNKKVDEEKKKLQDEINRLQASLKQLKEGGVPVRIVYAPSSGSADRTSSLDSDEKLLYDELQRELMDLKRHMRQLDQDSSRKVVEAETEAALWQEKLKVQQQKFEKELDQHRQEAELMREKQEARIQVIAQDLDQAQYIADCLQQMLNARETTLQDELGAADLSNQMISAQEEELSRLYNILEAQRGEIENLNQMLDYLAAQGPDGVGPGFDDELWRIRQEVNKLKETLAMQSAYVQSMPGSHSYGTQAGSAPVPIFQPSSQARGIGVGSGTAGHVGTAVAAGDAFGVSSRATTTAGSENIPSADQPQSQGFSVGVPLRRSGALPPVSAADSVGSQPYIYPPASAAQQQRQVSGPGSSALPLTRSGQSLGLSDDPRSNFGGHLGNERRESKAPPGGRSAVGRRERTTPAQQNSLSSERGSSKPSADQSHRPTSFPSAFEPVRRPEPYNPLSTQGAAGTGSLRQLVAQDTNLFATQPSLRGQFPPAALETAIGDAVDRFAQGAGAGGRQGFLPPTLTGDGGDSRVPWSGGSLQPVVSMPIPVYPAPPPHLQTGQETHPLPSVFTPGEVVSGPQVAFNPFVTRYSYSPGGVAPPGAGHVFVAQAASPALGVYNFGSQTYLPTAPAQRLVYQPDRTFVPASADGGDSARIYYSAGAPIPVPAPGVPPPIYQPVGMVSSSSPVPYSSYMPVTPIATGTPVRGGQTVPVNFDGSFAAMPPSPIRASGMESPTRGILKNAGGVGVGDDSYLFCNVPEHHELEDYIAELQEKLKRLKGKLFEEREIKEVILEDNDKKLVKRLLDELEDRRDELEGLDLAIEQQKRNLKEMKREERALKRERTDARGELEKLRENNISKLSKIFRNGDDDNFDEAMDRSRQRYLQDELACVQQTLAKRQAQLLEAERALKTTNNDLKEVREQAREMVKRYDDAASNLQATVSEQQEIDRRANEVGVQLVKNMDRLAQVKADLKDFDRKRSKQERLLRDINQVISKKDSEFKELDSRAKAVQQTLQRVTEELALSSQREKETVEALRDSEDILGKRRAELVRMRDQVEGQRLELERLDQQVGHKKTELQLLQESQERRQDELNSFLRHVESDLSSKQRVVKEEEDQLQQLTEQQVELMNSIKVRRAELHKLQDDVRQEEEVLQRLASSVDKNKSELKHTYEMEKLEQNELESLRSQHAQKMADLEKVQREFLAEKSSLEQLNAETSRKSGELERLRQAVERERAEAESLASQKQKLTEEISALSREQGLLEDGCRSMDDKLITMKRTQQMTEEKLGVGGRRLEALEGQLAERGREMEESDLQRTILHKDVQMLKQNLKDSQTELEQLHENIRDAESMLSNLRQDLRAEQQKRDSARLEAQRLTDAIRHSNSIYEEAVRQERAKQEELLDLVRGIEEKEREQEDARKALNRVRLEIENEENKLNKLLSNANNNLEQVRTDLMKKQEELDRTAQTLTELKKEASQLHASGEQFAEMQAKIEELEKEMVERNTEKNELAGALSASYEEVQRLRKESSEAHEKLRKDQVEFETTLSDIQSQLELSRQELQQVEKRSTVQVTELQSIAEQQFQRASTLNEELHKLKQDSSADTKKQPLSDDKENQRVSRPAASVLSRKSARDDWVVKHGHLRERLVEEQEYLKFQLKHQMTRHNQMMESARRKSDETIEFLKRKLGSLQEVLFNPDVQAIRDLTRSRSQSPVRYDRRRSPSPGKSYLTQRRSRSRSFERMCSPMIPERDYMC